MRTRILKLARGGASVALLATGLGAVGALGVGLATSGVAGAVTATYACHTPVGTLTVPTAVVDTNVAPASLYTNTSYAMKPKVTFTVPGTLIALYHTAQPTSTHFTVTKMQLHLKLTGFTATTLLALTANNTPVRVTVNTTTLAHGTSITFTYPTTSITMKKASGTATVKPGRLTTTILVSFGCGAPGQTYTATAKYYVGTTSAAAVDTIASSGFKPLALTPAAGALPGGTATLLYTHGANYWTASGGHGGNVFSETGTLDGLTFSSSGNHASLTGTPTAAGTFGFTVSVNTATSTGPVTQHYTITVAAAPATPKVVQPFKLTVTPGSLTLTCTSVTGGPKAANAVENQTTAKNCTLITLGHVTLNETNQLVTTTGHPLIISTARGEPTDSWALYAVMVPSSTTLTGNPACGTVQGFCNVTTTGPTTLAHHFANTSILPNYLTVGGYTCKPNQTATTPYFNTNPTPTTSAGQHVGTPAGLSVQYELCTAAAGSSGGEFFVKTLGYSLVVPPNVYAGTYYGTVQYTLSSNATVVPPNPVTPPQ
jgi:hypothetical protein